MCGLHQSSILYMEWYGMVCKNYVYNFRYALWSGSSLLAKSKCQVCFIQAAPAY